MSDPITPTPENPIPDVDEVKPGIPTPAWADEGGSDLPAVTSQDAGKVLTVSDDGEWVAGEGGGGGGGGTMVIAGTVSAGGSHITLDKTWKEIFDAMTSGIVPVVMWEEEDTYKYREPVNSANCSVGQYVVYTYNGVFVTDTENGYPDMSRD